MLAVGLGASQISKKSLELLCPSSPTNFSTDSMALSTTADVVSVSGVIDLRG